jgi:hypothetical protein
MTNTEQLLALFTNNVPTASQNMLDLVGTGPGVTLVSEPDGVVIFSVDDSVPGALFPFAGVPLGSGNVFTVPFEFVPATVTVFVNGLALLNSSYTLTDGTTFTLATPLGETDTIFISGFHSF